MIKHYWDNIESTQPISHNVLLWLFFLKNFSVLHNQWDFVKEKFDVYLGLQTYSHQYSILCFMLVFMLFFAY